MGADEDHEFEQIAMAAVGIGLSIWLGPQFSQFIGGTLGAAGGTFAAATSTAAAGLGNVALSGALTSFTTSAATQLIANGEIDFGQAFKSGVTAALTAGIGGSLGLNADLNGASFAQHLTQWGGQALVSAGVNTAINGGSFGNAFVNSFVGSAAAGAANWIGDHAGAGQLLGEVGSPMHVLAHAALGCAAAAATDKDCASGAVGGASSALLTSFLDTPTDASGNARSWTQAERVLITAGSTLVSALVADGAGLDSLVALNAAANEVQNNYLKHNELLDRFRAGLACDRGDATACARRDALDTLSQRRQAQMGACCDQGVEQCRQINWEMEQDLATLQFYEQELRAQAAATLEPEARDLLGLHIREVRNHQRQVASNLKTNYSVLANENTDSLEWSRVQQLNAQFGGAEIMSVFGIGGAGLFGRGIVLPTPRSTGLARTDGVLTSPARRVGKTIDLHYNPATGKFEMPGGNATVSNAAVTPPALPAPPTPRGLLEYKPNAESGSNSAVVTDVWGGCECPLRMACFRYGGQDPGSFARY